MRSIFADFPLARSCPVGVLRRVREIEPTADVLYLGPRQWLVGPVKPDTRARGSQIPVLQNLFRIPPKKRSASWHRRVTMARAKALGFRPALVHEHNDADGELVEDFRAATQQLRSDFLAQMDAEEHAHKAMLEADLADPGRAREAWKYAFTRSHAPGAPIQSVRRIPSTTTVHRTPTPAA